jgi:hypothetical protein
MTACGALAAISVSGCTSPSAAVEQTSHTFLAPNDAHDDRLWQASQDVLREHYFRIDRLDRRAGIISTHPETAQHFFEFWRRDVNTPLDFCEASLRTLRRRAIVQLQATVDSPESVLTVTVLRELFSTPERQFDNSIAALRMFDNDLPGERTGRPVSRADDYWISDGRDPAMEHHLLDRIITEYNRKP